MTSAKYARTRREPLDVGWLPAEEEVRLETGHTEELNGGLGRLRLLLAGHAHALTDNDGAKQ